jgi:hypothetical protein
VYLKPGICILSKQVTQLYLSTYGAVSLFSTVLTNALEQQKINIIQHFESRFAKNEKQTGVEAVLLWR